MGKTGLDNCNHRYYWFYGPRAFTFCFSLKTKCFKNKTR